MKIRFKVLHKSLLKEGETNGRKWQMVKLETDGGRNLITFAGKNYDEGLSYEREIQEKKRTFKGKEYIDYAVIEPREKEAPKSYPQPNKATELLEEIKNILVDILEVLSQNKAN